MITIKRPRCLLDTAASDPTSYCRELTPRKLFQGNEGCSPGVTAHPATLLLLRRTAAREAFQKLPPQFQTCSSLKEHTPTKWQGGQADCPGHSTVKQTNKQTHTQTHLTAKKKRAQRLQLIFLLCLSLFPIKSQHRKAESPTSIRCSPG